MKILATPKIVHTVEVVLFKDALLQLYQLVNKGGYLLG